MRISDWSSDVCSSDLSCENSLAPRLTPRCARGVVVRKEVNMVRRYAASLGASQLPPPARKVSDEIEQRRSEHDGGGDEDEQARDGQDADGKHVACDREQCRSERCDLVSAGGSGGDGGGHVVDATDAFSGRRPPVVLTAHPSRMMRLPRAGRSAERPVGKE